MRGNVFLIKYQGGSLRVVGGGGGGGQMPPSTPQLKLEYVYILHVRGSGNDGI